MKSGAIPLPLYSAALLCVVIFGFACFLPKATAAERWAYESANEFFNAGDFDGDGRDDLVVSDKETGAFRVALQLSPEVYTWNLPAHAGFSNLTSVASGRFLNSTQDALAFVAPEANRIQVASLGSAASPWLPTDRHITNHGPNTLTGIDIPGAGNVSGIDDIYLGSIWNDPSPFAHTTFRNSTALSPLVNQPLGGSPDRANAVRLVTGSPLHPAIILRQGAFDTLLVSSNHGTTLSAVALAAVPAGSDFVAHPFEAGNSLSRFVVWTSGSSNLVRAPIVTNTAGGLLFGTGNTLRIDLPVAQVFLLKRPSLSRLLVVHSGNTTQSIYTYDGTTNSPSLVFRTNAPSGETFTGALPVDGRDFISFTSDDGTGRTTTMRHAREVGGGYRYGPPVSLPRLAHFAGQGNVLFFEREPFVAEEPGLVARLNAGDWSSAPVLGANVTVVRETYASEPGGLASPTLVQLGAAPPSATSVLINQRATNISYFSLSAPLGTVVSDVTISPNGGTFDRAIWVSANADKLTDHYVRLNGSGPWMRYLGPILILSNTTVQAYAQSVSGSARSVIKSAEFILRVPVGDLDSDGDGVPDYVERSRNLDPTSGSDADGDAWSDLEELVNGSDPGNPASTPPPGTAPVSLNAGVTIEANPVPRDYLRSVAATAAVGTLVRLHTAEGEFIGEQSVAAPTTSNPNRAARFENVVADPKSGLLTLVTEPHFEIQTTNSDSLLGRELIHLLLPPVRPAVIISNVYTGSDSRDASNWVTAARLALSNAPTAVATTSFDRFDTLSALLIERKLGEILLQRSNHWASSNLTLFPGRTLDLSRTNLTSAMLASVEQRQGFSPGYRLATILDSITNDVVSGSVAGVPQLKTFAGEVYRVSSLSNNLAPGTYPLPVDVIRQFLERGTVQSNYVPVIVMTSNQLALARLGASNVLARVPPRPETNLTVTLSADSCAPGITLVRDAAGGLHSLVDSAGLPFTLPQSFELLPASQFFVSAYVDATVDSSVPELCRSNPLEVITASLVATPVASDPDTDGNLLVDSWEEAFFGAMGSHPFRDTDNDGFQDLQEMLEGTDPGDVLNIPGVSAQALGPIPLRTRRLADNMIEVRWRWPVQYVSAVQFGIEGAARLGDQFSTLPVSPNLEGDDYVVVLSPTSDTAFYLRLFVRLR